MFSPQILSVNVPNSYIRVSSERCICRLCSVSEGCVWSTSGYVQSVNTAFDCCMNTFSLCREVSSIPTRSSAENILVADVSTTVL